MCVSLQLAHKSISPSLSRIAALLLERRPEKWQLVCITVEIFNRFNGITKMALSCEFELLDNPNHVYYGGQTLNGRVSLTATKAAYIRGILFSKKTFSFIHVLVDQWFFLSPIVFFLATVFYVVIKGKGCVRSEKNFAESEYFREKIYFLGAENGKSFNFVVISFRKNCVQKIHREN